VRNEPSTTPHPCEIRPKEHTGSIGVGEIDSIIDPNDFDWRGMDIGRRYAEYLLWLQHELFILENEWNLAAELRIICI